MTDPIKSKTLPFLPVSFSFPDRAIAVKDKKTGNQSAAGVALVHIPLVGGALTLQTVIWETVPFKDANGDMATEVTVSLPRGFSLTDTKDDEAQKDMLDAWKLGVLQSYDAWRDGASKDGKAGPKARLSPRLVKAVKAAPAPTA